MIFTDERKEAYSCIFDGALKQSATAIQLGNGVNLLPLQFSHGSSISDIVRGIGLA